MYKVDTIIFDLDNTLLDKNKSLINFANNQYEQFMLTKYNIDKQAFIETFLRLNNIVMPKEEVYRELVKLLSIDRHLYDLLLDDLNTNFHKYSVGFIGFDEVLKNFKEKHYKLGLLTNGRGFYQRNKVEALGIEQYFDCIIISGEVNLRKPDHRIFKLVLNHLNAQATHTVMVGDNLLDDIIPAKGLGMYTIQRSENEINDQHPSADAICYHLNDILNIIDKLK